MLPVEVLQQLADGAKNERDRIMAAKALSDREVKLTQLGKAQRLRAENLESKATQFLSLCATPEEKAVLRRILARAIAQLEAAGDPTREDE